MTAAPYTSIPHLVDTAADPECSTCLGGGWVCEEHPDRPFDTGDPQSCSCSAGQPCACTGMAGS